MGKYLGQNLPSIQVTSLRYILSILVLVPVILYQGKQSLRTNHPWMHLVRGILLVFAMAFWFSGLTHVPITLATIISFSIPLFVLPMASYFLKEKVGWQRSIATMIGFIGVLIVIEPHKLNMNPQVLFMLGAAILFSTLDIINKKFVIEETTISMLFYPGLIAAILSTIPAVSVWVWPSAFQWAILAGLGVGSNLILFFILKAFALSDASFLAPFRYTEILVSAAFGYLLFSEIPTNATIIGGMIIIASTFYVAYKENKQEGEGSAH